MSSDDIVKTVLSALALFLLAGAEAFRRHQKGQKTDPISRSSGPVEKAVIRDVEARSSGTYVEVSAQITQMALRLAELQAQELARIRQDKDSEVKLLRDELNAIKNNLTPAVDGRG